MKKIITGAQVAGYVGIRTGTVIHKPYTALGIEQDGRITAGVVFNGYNKCDVDITAAGERGAFTRAFLRRISQYVFEELGCQRASFVTEQDSVIGLLHRLNAKIEGCKQNHFGKGRDGIILGILREDWKL